MANGSAVHKGRNTVKRARLEELVSETFLRNPGGDALDFIQGPKTGPIDL